MEKGIIIRHLEEVEGENIDMDRDTDIDPKEIGLLKEHYIPAILKEIKSDKYDHLVIVSSDKARSKTTAEILIEEISKHKDIPITQEVDPRISAEIHGKYKKGVRIDDPLIKKAKFIYLKEVFEKDNIWYRWGSAINDFDSETYPELAEIFDSPGENQIELNIRTYRFVLDLINKIKENPKTLHIISTHNYIISTVLSLIYMVDKGESHSSLPLYLYYHPSGQMHKDTVKSTEEMIGGWDKFYEFYKLKNYIFDIDITKLEKIETTIQSELDISLAQYMQHYKRTI